MRFGLALGMLQCATSLACTAEAPHASVTPRPVDSFASVVRVLVGDSAMAGAGRAERAVTATDSFTVRLLEQAGIPTAPPVDGQVLLCPASTLANGTAPPGLRGYYLRLEVVSGTGAPADPAVRVLRITHSCRFMYQGEFSRGGVFATTTYWEVHLSDGRWRIARRLGFSIT